MSADATPPPASGTGLIGTVLSGRYRLESKLGSGGMSTVYLALDETLQRRVAIKVLHREMHDQPDQLERFRRESRAVAQLAHPNVVAVIDAGDDAGHPYIVFEYVEGETLKERIDRFGRLPLDEAAAYSIEIGRGLQAAHLAHMVHRDVKPQNILIDAEGRAKVTDFGIALSMQADGLTKTGRVLGTTDYVSPEQAMGREVDARSDIYSLGILLFEMLIGDVPFKAETLVGVAMKHVNDPMPDVQKRRPGVSAALASVVERATQKEPKKRYPDMGAMLADLEGALEVEIARSGGGTGDTTTVLDSVPARQRLLSSRTVSIAGILLVLAGVLVALALVELGGEGAKRGADVRDDPIAQGSGDEFELQEAIDFDPEGTGEGEHPDEVGLALDGDPTTTSWLTETYTGAAAMVDNGKSGVGLIVDAGDVVAGRDLQITTENPGWGGVIYAAADGPPEDLAGWGEPISSPFTVDEDETTVPLNTNDSRFYLIWITDLTENPEDAGFFATISDVALLS